MDKLNYALYLLRIVERQYSTWINLDAIYHSQLIAPFCYKLLRFLILGPYNGQP